ncbi:response regulator [Flavobacterium sp. RSB2_4_14]|uniref:response regulator n=1 Tax=Flavobacterium sp. RSB2_4_14 TaxID=3447665 RepID=UPI003F3AA657
MLDTIFCVDDDPITLMLCKKVIERASFAKEIHTAKDGEEAIQYFDELAKKSKDGKDISYPKLTFLDLNMPIMNGWEFLEIYTQKGYPNLFIDAKFIVLSSTIDPQDVNKTKIYTVVVDFLSKPITKEMLGNLKDRFL